MAGLGASNLAMYVVVLVPLTGLTLAASLYPSAPES